MSGAGGDGGDGGNEVTPTPAVTYRVAAKEDFGKPGLTFYKKKADALAPEDPPTPVDATTVTVDNITDYVVEYSAPSNDLDAPAAPVLDAPAAPVLDAPAASAVNQEALVAQGLPIARAIQHELENTKDGGRRRSKRRHPKKGSRKSKKGGRARKSKKGGRSRKNGSKHRKHSRAHKKH
jgi:hypothetical protein